MAFLHATRSDSIYNFVTGSMGRWYDHRVGPAGHSSFAPAPRSNGGPPGVQPSSVRISYGQCSEVRVTVNRSDCANIMFSHSPSVGENRISFFALSMLHRK